MTPVPWRARGARAVTRGFAGSKANVLFIATSTYYFYVVQVIGGPNFVIASAIFIITDDPSNNVATMLGK